MSHLPFLIIDPDDDSVAQSGTMERKQSIDRTAPIASLTRKASVTADELHDLIVDAPAPKSSSRIPGFVAFPLAVILTLGTSAALYSGAAELTGFELATISRNVDEPLEIGALLGWRVFELIINWGAGFDYWDVASLVLLTNSSYYVLLSLFYTISPISILLSLSIDLFSTAVPFFLLRKVNPYNDSLPEKSVTTSTTKLYVSIFGTVIYGTTLYASLQTFLPAYIVSTFDSIRSLQAAHDASIFILLTACIPLGNAAKDFLFTPATFNARGAIVEEFDPTSATLGETFAYNIGLSGWTKREEILVRRTTLLGLLTIGNSLAKIWGTVEGAEAWGALGWGAVFAAAHGLAGAGIAYVGDV
ncbi:hypothetical protein CAC42_5604 [Sphaceloma murrayae]|uniref:Uncharacterized protein n=1 Tax=Sphaceloma murrayae TaxID=2082308 RepID=A0A2K1QYM4_9PEZI|nr:hypothetical protein CAC42_5604 [Sphaceloma murrayae]